MIEDLYLKKLMNLVPLAFFDLTDNMLCLYEERSKFEENDLLSNSLSNIFQLYSALKDINPDNLSEKVKFCSEERQKYFNILLSLLNKMDYIHHISFEKEIKNLLEDEIDAMDYSNISKTKDFSNVLNTCMSTILPYLTDSQRYDFVKNLFIKNNNNMELFTLDSLLYSILNKVSTKINLGEDIFEFHTLINSDKTLEELMEVSELSLKYFHFCQYIFNCYTNFIAIYTYFEEFNLMLDNDLILKDIYFTSIKIVIDNDKIFLENIMDKVGQMLDVYYTEKENLDKIFEEQNFSEERKKIEHKHIDSIVNLLNETPHYIGEFVSNKNNINLIATDEIIETRIAEFMDELYKSMGDLSEIEKIIVYMSVINNILVAMKFYKISDAPISSYTTTEVENLVKNIIENANSSTKDLVTLSLSKFINY